MHQSWLYPYTRANFRARLFHLVNAAHTCPIPTISPPAPPCVRTACAVSGAILENMQVTDLHETSQEQLLTYLQMFQEDLNLGLQQPPTDVTTSVLKKWIEALKREVPPEESNLSTTAAPNCTIQSGSGPEAASVRA
ncbi:hypothetical protein lerEdw1_011183 [Lerista edwardsae]|nr:hypothetical protein lerEdw1_011183 [Lerista edwardsae]